jgi:hypothetical protein
MKNFCLLAFFFVSFYFQGHAQQNLFNAPSGTITPKGKWFYQHQFNYYNPGKQASKQHFVYGLGSNFEVGVNLLNVGIKPFNPEKPLIPINYRDQSQALGPILAITGQKLFQLGEHWQASVGTQVGSNLAFNGDRPQFTHFSYSLLIWEPRHHWRFVAGPYYTDWRIVGPGNRAGLMLGYEIPITKNFYLMGDVISGRTESSVSVIGGMYNVSRYVQLCLGAMVANPASPSPNGIVFEVNLFNF